MAVSVSRPHLESCLPTRVRALPEVSFTPACDVLGPDSTPTRVTGVGVLWRADGNAEEWVGAALATPPACGQT
jgi:hypothetical protein